MSKKRNGEENRRFQRVYFDVKDGEDQSIVGLEAVWLGENRVSVFDISYTGAAVVRPANVDLKVCHVYKLKFEFQGQHVCEMNAEVMWFNDRMVGLAFSELAGQDRIRFSEFLSDKLIGANLRKVSDEFIGPNSNFDLWYQGPKETSVYIWLDENKKATKVHVMLGDENFEWDHLKGVTMGRAIEQRVLDLLSQIEDEKDVFSHIIKLLKSN